MRTLKAYARRAAWAPFALAFAAGPLCAAQEPRLPSSSQLAEMSLEELANYPVTSVSRKAERLSDAAAAVFVITNDDIRRSGARNIGDVLRLAPNLQVAQVSATGYAINARGVYNTAADKLLVLVDGRTVYSPLFAGVFWDVQDLVLEDIDRIEVVSGPGGTLWGVNAVNGVINVITRSAAATQGALVSAGGGNADSSVSARYGSRLGDHAHARFFAEYFDRNSSRLASGDAVHDAAHLSRVGFRSDWAAGADRIMLQGGAYEGTMNQPAPGSVSISGVDLVLAPVPVSGANVNFSWTRSGSDGSESMVQAYVDRSERTVPPTFGQQLDLFDILFQQSLHPAGLVSVVWGAEHRIGRDRIANQAIFAFLPANVTQRWSSLFAQADAHLTPTLQLSAGARAERNDYTGTEFLPSLRLSWKVAPDDLLWSAASRTVRAPSRLDRDPFVPGQPPFLLAGGPQAPAEVARVLEVGYRGIRWGRLSYSITAYHADYDHLHTQEIAPSRTFLTFDGKMQAVTEGVEAWGTWQVSNEWRLSAGYTAERERFRLHADSNDLDAPALSGRDPAHAWQVRSSFNPSRATELDITLRAVAGLSDPVVSPYRTVDVRFGWRPVTGLEAFVAGRNLADGGHTEFGPISTSSELRRSVYVGLRWQFDAF